MQEVAHRTVLARLRPWLALLAVAAVCVAIVVAGDPTMRALRYERDALLDGQVWRAFTGHLVHTSWRHLLVDLAVASLVVAVYGRHIRPAAIVLCAAGTSAGLFLFAPYSRTYTGLEGILLGLIVFGALEGGRQLRRYWLPAVPLMGLAIVADMWRVGTAIGEGDEWRAAVLTAWICGAISGALAFRLLYRPSRSRL